MLARRETLRAIFSQVWARYSRLPPLVGICEITPHAVRDTEFLARVVRREFDDRAPQCAVMYAVPYLTRESGGERRNMAAFAVFPDYHAFMARLGDDYCAALRERFPDNRFAAFCDHSPLCEVDCAVASGLGSCGRNNLLITEAYGSYVFIGAVVCDVECGDGRIPEKPGRVDPAPTGTYHPSCTDCGMCIRACPTGALHPDFDAGKCLSAITQSRHPPPEKLSLIAQCGSVWGCDECQDCCPCNAPERLTYSDVEYFMSERIPYLDVGTLAAMDEVRFESRAYGWRGREVVGRNASLPPTP